MKTNIDDLKRKVSYDPLTGKFTTSSGRVGYVTKTGHLTVKFGGKTRSAARLAWIYMTGRPPPKGMDVDHINRNPEDNRWCNLRLANRSENKANSKKYKNNKSGYKGVYFDKQKNKWRGEVNFRGVRSRSRYFSAPENAYYWCCAERLRVHGEYAHNP